jgi:hypothetical protein
MNQKEITDPNYSWTWWRSSKRLEIYINSWN